MLDQRGRLLVAALGFAGLPLPSYDRALHALRSWLDSWSGIGLIVVGMTHRGFQVGVGERGAGQWIAVFYHGGGGHEPIDAAGTAQEPTPWRAVQRAAWAVMERTARRCREVVPRSRPNPHQATVVRVRLS